MAPDEDKGCSSSMCQLFDFEIAQLKEMFPLCSDDVLNVAMGKSANLEEAVDYVMQQTGTTENTGLHKEAKWGCFLHFNLRKWFIYLLKSERRTLLYVDEVIITHLLRDILKWMPSFKCP
jgi:hypothetical protein